LSALARDPALVDIFKEYHDRKVNKPNSLVLDLWLIKALYDAGYALRADEAGISLPLTSGFRRAVWRVFLGVVWAPLLRAADYQTPALFAKTLAGAERLLKHPRIVRGFIKVFKRKYPRVSILTFEAFSHSVEEKVAAAADRYDPTIPKYGNRRAKFTTFIWTALTREFIRFNRRETLGGDSINAQIEKSFDDEVKKDIHYDKQQALIDAYEGDRGQTWIDVYADVTGAAPGESERDIGEMAEALNENQRVVFENWSMSGKALADKIGVSEPRVSQLRGEIVEALKGYKGGHSDDIIQTSGIPGSYGPGQKSVLPVPSDDWKVEYMAEQALARRRRERKK
jgi:hypothetical protein